MIPKISAEGQVLLNSGGDAKLINSPLKRSKSQLCSTKKYRPSAPDFNSLREKNQNLFFFLIVAFFC